MEQMTPVRKEEIRESIRIIVQEMLPYAREFRPLVGELINQGLAKNWAMLVIGGEQLSPQAGGP